MSKTVEKVVINPESIDVGKRPMIKAFWTAICCIFVVTDINNPIPK